MHLLDRPGGVDVGDELLALEQLDDRSGLGVVVGEASGECLGGVVVPRDEAALAGVAHVVDLGPRRHEVVVEATALAEPAGQDSPVDLLVGKLQHDHAVEVVALEEELRLAGVARESRRR